MIQRSASSCSSSPSRLELAGALGEIGEDHARLGELLGAVHQHRHFAHLVDLGAVLRRARLAALEEIDIDRLPVGADQIEHQRGAIGIAGLGEAVELIFGHWRSCHACEDLARQRRPASPHGGFAVEALPPSTAEAAPAAGSLWSRIIRRPLDGPFAAGEEFPGQPPSGAIVPSTALGRAAPNVMWHCPRPGELSSQRPAMLSASRSACRRRRADASEVEAAERAAAAGERRAAQRSGHARAHGNVTHALPHFIVGMTNSAPSLVPEGQRAVTVLVLV